MTTLTGEYIYLLNGEPTGVSESFEIIENGDDTVTVSHRDARVFGSAISVETLERDDRFVSADITFTSETTVNAKYLFDNETYHFIRKRDGNVVNDETQRMPSGGLFFPLMRVFQGPLITKIAASNTEIDVIVPFVENPNDLDRLLTPTIDSRTAKLIDETNGVRKFNYLSKHYDDASEFFVSEQGLLDSYRFPQTADRIWEVRLTKVRPTTP